MYYSAFTAAELGEMLPKKFKAYFQNWILRIDWNRDGRNHVTYIEDGDSRLASGEDKNEANARARILIYLLEDNLYTPDKKSAVSISN